MTSPWLRRRWHLAVLLVVTPFLLSGCRWMAILAQTDGIDDALSDAEISADGGRVAWVLDYGPELDHMYISVRDLATGGTAGISKAREPSLDGPGRLVAHTRWEDDIHRYQVYVRDLDTGTDVLVSANTSGERSKGTQPSISQDGRWVAFVSSATDLVTDDGNSQADVFVRDTLPPGVTTRASVSTTGGDPDGASRQPSTSGSGRFVAFVSSATNLVAGDGNGHTDVFVRDLAAGTTTRASVGADGSEPDGDSTEPAISADGRYVAFTSTATNLVPGDTNGVTDVFLRDLQTGTTTLVSVDLQGGPANGGNGHADLSGDGRHVAFTSWASDVVPSDTNGQGDVFVRDTWAGTTRRVSVDPIGQQLDAGSLRPSLSGEGTLVAFTSRAVDLAGDPPYVDSVYAGAVTVPSIAQISPPSVARGETATVTVSGAGFTPETSLLVAPSAAGVTVDSVTVLSPTTLQASITVDASATTGPVRVTTFTPGPGPGLLPGSYGPCITCFSVT